jgi:hypothetical protein
MLALISPPVQIFTCVHITKYPAYTAWHILYTAGTSIAIKHLAALKYLPT